MEITLPHFLVVHDPEDINKYGLFRFHILDNLKDHTRYRILGC